MGNHLAQVKEGMWDQFWAGETVDPARFAITQAYEQLLGSLSTSTAEDFAGFGDE